MAEKFWMERTKMGSACSSPPPSRRPPAAGGLTPAYNRASTFAAGRSVGALEALAGVASPSPIPPSAMSEVASTAVSKRSGMSCSTQVLKAKLDLLEQELLEERKHRVKVESDLEGLKLGLSQKLT